MSFVIAVIEEQLSSRTFVASSVPLTRICNPHERKCGDEQIREAHHLARVDLRNDRLDRSRVVETLHIHEKQAT